MTKALRRRAPLRVPSHKRAITRPRFLPVTWTRKQRSRDSLTTRSGNIGSLRSQNPRSFSQLDRRAKTKRGTSFSFALNKTSTFGESDRTVEAATRDCDGDAADARENCPAALSAGPGTQVTSSPNLGRVSSPATWDMDGFAGLMSQVAPQKEDVDNRIVPGSARYDPVTQLAPAVRSFVPRPSFRSPGHERQDTGAKGPQ